MKAYSINLLFWVLASVAVFSFMHLDRSSDASPAKHEVNSPTELVMKVGTSIEAGRKESIIKIIAVGRLDWVYGWRACKLSSSLRERYKRWYGSLGAYDPGFSFGFWSSGCEGISRTVVSEGQIHFDDEKLAAEWIRRRPNFYTTAWSKNGLLVSWALSPSRSQLSVDVWLMCLNGKPYNASLEAIGTILNVASTEEGQPV